MNVRGFLGRWFRDLTEADTRVLSVFRIVHGLTLAAYVAWTPLFGRLEAFFTDQGLYPVALLHDMVPDHADATLFRFVHTEGQAELAFGLGVLVCLLYAAGAFTRLSSVAVLLFLTSLHHRAHFAISGSMATANAFALYAALLPLGRHWSVDAYLARRRGTPLPPTRIRSIAMLLVHAQFFVLYAFNVIHKSGPTWRDGTAVHYVLANTDYAWPLGVLVGTHAPVAAIRFMTFATLALEATIALAVISPFARAGCRRYAVLAIVVLHLSFSALLNVGPFVVFLVPAAILLLAADDGSFSSRPRLDPAGVIVEAPILGARRGRLLREATSIAAFVMVAACARRDLGAITFLFGPTDLPAAIARPANFFGISQRWSMFSADPVRRLVRLLLVVELEDGRMIDTRTRREIDFELLDGRPLDPDFYWEKAEEAYAGRTTFESYEALAGYVARRPEVDGYRGAPRVRSVEIHQLDATVPQLGEPAGPIGSVVLFVKPLLPTPLPGRRP